MADRYGIAVRAVSGRMRPCVEAICARESATSNEADLELPRPVAIICEHMPDEPSSLGSAFAEAFGPLFVINLPSRKDRRRQFAAQLSRIGLSINDRWVRVHPAVRPETADGFPSIGARGCFLSHLTVLRTAVAENLGSLIVCEDDLDFSEDFPQRAQEVLGALRNARWDIFYAGHHGLPDTLVPDLPGPMVRLDAHQRVVAAHFVVFRRSVLAPLVAYLDAILARPPGHAEGGPMHVDGAFSRFRADHPEMITLAALPPLGHQRASRTDIHALRWFDRLPMIRNAAGAARAASVRLRKGGRPR